MINPIIFKSYDVRGVYPSELNEEAAFKIGRAFAEYTRAKNVAVGRDMRLSSPALFESLTKGIVSQGANVFDIGQVPTEGMYFAVQNSDCGAGIMITASHNPKEYNGFKLVKKGKGRVQFISGKEMAKAFGAKNLAKVKEPGAIKKLDIWQGYLKHIFSLVDVSKIKPLKVVIDAGNGMAGKVIPKIAPKLAVKIIPLNFNLDGNFPAHPSNPLEKGVADQISKKIKEEKADLGFIFDGDADRVFLVDEKGDFKSGDITILLLSKYLLKKNPGKGIVYNLICSKAVPEFIKKWGGKPIRTPVGFLNVLKGLLEKKGIMGGEISGHYSFKDSYYSDSGFVAFLTLLEMISEENRKVSDITNELSVYSKSPEINFRIDNKEEIINKIKEKYSDGKQDYLDGVTVEYKDWWFNVRPSNTEPLLRLTIEADNKKLLEEKKKELAKFIEE